jgi:uncharacterized DUF497 family protein
MHTYPLKAPVNGFDWDEGNAGKCQEHGVSLPEIEALFRRPFSVFPDVGHSRAEERLIAVGTSERDRYILVVFTRRERAGETLVRPISARYMHRKEVEHYEKEIATTQER